MKKVMMVLIVLSILFVSGTSGCGQQSNQQTEIGGTVENIITPSNAIPESGGSPILIEGFAFNPSEIIVNVGTVVTWENQDLAAHTLASDSFQSPIIGKGESYSFTFTESGTFEYYCSIHPSMKGRVIVN